MVGRGFGARARCWFLVALFAAVACSDDSATGGSPSGGSSNGGSSNGGGSSDGGSSQNGGGGAGSGGVVDPGCEGPLGAPVDPDTLPACCPMYGEAHCVASVPAELETVVAPCDGGGYCVPDVFIETGGVFTPASCASLGGPGVCLSICIPLVAENAALLPQDICASYEKCVPCISPIDGTETGACDIGFTCDGEGGGGGGGEGGASPGCDDPSTCEYDIETTCAGQPVADPNLFSACPVSLCGGGGHCVPSTLIDPAQAALLADCDGSSKCVPDDFIETGGLFTPDTCDSIGGFEGRCLSACLPDVASQLSQLPQDACAADERCVPCYDPFDGTATGACTLSCDPGPAGPVESFPACCRMLGGGLCLPVDLVGQGAADQLDAEECTNLGEAGSVCVPDVIWQAHADNMLFVPQDCETSFLAQLFGASAEGGCLPRCIPEVDGQFGLDQDICPNEFFCVPCIDQNGANTGACDPQ